MYISERGVARLRDFSGYFSQFACRNGEWRAMLPNDTLKKL